jgi:hypothetical protein
VNSFPSVDSLRVTDTLRHMEEAQADAQRWPILNEDDEKLLQELQSILTARAVGDPYSQDGEFARTLASLPVGLRAMAATHWLDISLTMDSITWHFGNFGEPGLVALTELGLIELNLPELASCFAEARDLMIPLLRGRTESDGDPDEMMERKGLSERADKINRRAWDLDSSGPEESIIYSAWTAYARKNPEKVFAD